MSEMRILTVRQPWSEAIIFGGKDVENRVRNIAGDYRGAIAIHSSKRPAKPAEWREFEARFPDAMLRMAESVPWAQEEFGVIIGVVDLVDAHFGATLTPTCYRSPEGGTEYVIPSPVCSPWGDSDAYHLVLENPRPLAQPIPYKGALGLRRLDETTMAAVWSQIERNEDDH